MYLDQEGALLSEKNRKRMGNKKHWTKKHWEKSENLIIK